MTHARDLMVDENKIRPEFVLSEEELEDMLDRVFGEEDADTESVQPSES